MKNERRWLNYAEQKRSSLGQRPDQPSVGDDNGRAAVTAPCDVEFTEPKPTTHRNLNFAN
eukprot:2413816-Pleurochrysis_carterae.AAC.1